MTVNRTERHFAYNVVGVMLPLLLTIFTTPIYLRLIGQGRYGVLALVWVIVGYLGLLDLGLSRASANRLARTQTPEDASAPFWAAFWTSLVLGMLGGIGFLIGGYALGPHLFPDSPELRGEIVRALPFVAVFIPLATTSGVLTGALEARQDFFGVNLIAIVGTVLSVLVPLIVAYTWGPSLALLLPAILVSRVVTVVWMARKSLQVLGLRRVEPPARGHIRDLLGYGGWAAVSSVVGTVMNSVDQIAIGAVLGAAAVAHYVVPYNVVMRIGVVPGALLRALFPRLSQGSDAAAKALELMALRALCVAMTGLCVSLILVIRPLLHLWLGQQLDPVSIPVAIILTVGVWFNAMANVPFWTLQARSRPDIPAKFHVMEIGPYLLILFSAMHAFGLIGAACAWALRMAVDAALLCIASRYRRVAYAPMFGGLVFVAAATAVALLSASAVVALGAGVAAIPAFAWWAWRTDPAIVGRVRALAIRTKVRVAALSTR